MLCGLTFIMLLLQQLTLGSAPRWIACWGTTTRSSGRSVATEQLAVTQHVSLRENTAYAVIHG